MSARCGILGGGDDKRLQTLVEKSQLQDNIKIELQE